MAEYLQDNNLNSLLNDPKVIGNVLFFYGHSGSFEDWNKIPWNERLNKMASARECEWIDRGNIFGRQKKEDYQNKIIRHIKRFFKEKTDYPVNEVGPLVVCKINEDMYVTLDGHHRGRLAGTGNNIGQICAQVIQPGELFFLGLTSEQLVSEAEEVLEDFFPTESNNNHKEP